MSTSIVLNPRIRTRASQIHGVRHHQVASLVDPLLAELRSILAAVRTDDGLISGSVYDSAQVLRFAPPADPLVVDWLIRHQHADGGWETPAVPLARTVPTLAALLALLAYHRHQCLPEQGQQALARTASWLLDHFQTSRVDTGAYWIGKELYRPVRISRVIELSATRACIEAGYGGGA